MLLIKSFLGDAAESFQFEHMVNKVGTVFHHQRWLRDLLLGENGRLTLVISFQGQV